MWPDSPDFDDDASDESLGTKWLRQIIVVVLALILALLQFGCVSAPVAPNLKFPEDQKACRSLALPPVPEHVRLIIDGDKIEADQGGKLLFRGYVSARSLFLRGAK